jgi:uncharacterized membrane protein YfcA
MKQAQAAVKTTQPASGDNLTTLGIIGMDVLNTAWRMALPVVILAVVGIFVDRAVDSAPLVTLLGVVLGFIIAGFLVKRQLAELERSDARAAHSRKEGRQ